MNKERPFLSSWLPEVLATIIMLLDEGPFMTTALYPSMVKVSPSFFATVITSFRSNLLCGSEKATDIWISPEMIFGKSSFFWSSEPNLLINPPAKTTFGI